MFKHELINQTKQFIFYPCSLVLGVFIFGCAVPLNQTIINGNIDQASKTILQGKEINSMDKYNRTPLMLASMKNYLRLVSLLLEYGADVNAVDKYGETALIKASKFKRREIAKLLINKGADINARGTHGQSSLTYALKKRDHNLVQYFIQKGADVNVVEEITGIGSQVEQENYLKASDRSFKFSFLDNRTPIMIALEMSGPESIELLLGSGADILFVSERGSTTLMSASKTGNLNFVNRVIKAGIDINSKTKKVWTRGESMTALMYAASAGHLEVVKKLIAEGADFETRNGSKYSAVALASHENKQDVANYLFKSGARSLIPLKMTF